MLSSSKSTKIDPAEISFFEKFQSLLATSQTKPHRGLPETIRRICGVDAHYSHEDNKNEVTAVAALLSADDIKLIETCSYRGHFTFPYVSGLFFLHEGPFVVAALKGLKEEPELVCFDAHGIAHPRGLGLATICGMILDVPSIGVAKSKLVGEATPYKEGIEKILYQDKEVGFLTRYEGVKTYWSPGFNVSLKQLEGIIAKQTEACIKSIAEADQIARSTAAVP